MHVTENTVLTTVLWDLTVAIDTETYGSLVYILNVEL